jgi:manganese transport protein
MPSPPSISTIARSDALTLGSRKARQGVAHRVRAARPSSSFWRKLVTFCGPGYMVAVGYMDPGNWATGIAAGSSFGYQLLCVVLLSNFMAMLLQGLAVKLGIVTGLDLAQACRQRYGAKTRLFLWVLCEIAIIACDLAEVIGAAIALKLLFGLPLLLGIGLTGLQVLLILGMQGRGCPKLGSIVISLMLVIGVCFAGELLLSQPNFGAIAEGMIPTFNIITDPAMLYLSVGILGATVMPHNLYLHSSLVKTQRHDGTMQGMREAIFYSKLDIATALTLAFLVNAAILILAAAAFHERGLTSVVGIEEAFSLLSPALGAGLASTLFAVALLASGQNSTITGTLAGQIVMEGFTNFKWPVWARRLVARGVALVPALFAVGYYGSEGVTKLLIFSQVVLCLQLPFAVFPLVRITNSRDAMGGFANQLGTKLTVWGIFALLLILNAMLAMEALR